MKTKIITQIAALLIVVTLSSCAKKKGCTDGSAKNFDGTAQKDDGSCTYEGSYVFWTKSGITAGESLNVYLNGVLQGNVAVLFPSAPACGATGALTVVKNLGSSKSQSYSITVDLDSAGIITPNVYVASTAIFIANTCTSEELK